jgi:hypothetical protein
MATPDRGILVAVAGPEIDGYDQSIVAGGMALVLRRQQAIRGCYSTSRSTSSR